MDLSYAFVIFINGVSLSLTYALMAIGFTLVFGVLRAINFAYGELLMVGAYVVWILSTANDVPFVVAIVAAIAVVGGVSLGIERGFFKPTRADPFRGFIISIGLMYVLQVIALLVFGPANKAVPVIFPGRIELLGSYFAIQKLALIPIIIGVIVAVWMFLERTKIGRAVRASIQDREAAALQGISQGRMCAIVMAIAGGLAGFAGGILSQGLSINPYFGTYFIVKAFIVVIVGGLGSVGGTLIAASLFGFLESILTSLVNPRITLLVDVVVLLFILAFRPRGFFGRE